MTDYKKPHHTFIMKDQKGIVKMDKNVFWENLTSAETVCGSARALLQQCGQAFEFTAKGLMQIRNEDGESEAVRWIRENYDLVSDLVHGAELLVQYSESILDVLSREERRETIFHG